MDNRARLTAFAAVLLLSTVLASAGTNSWTALGPAGGQVLKVAYNTANPSILYMISLGGFSRSQDGGATWQTTRSDFQVVGTLQADQPDSDTTDNRVTSDSTIAAETPPPVSSTPPAASSSNGGGGMISMQWLLGLLLALGVRIIGGYHEASRSHGVDRKSGRGCCPISG